MKKMTNTAFIYAIAAMVAGVFYREYTKIMGFTGLTSLRVMHVHLFALGTIVFLVLGLYCKQTKLGELKGFKTGITLYNIGLPWMVIMFLVRGITQVQGMVLTSGMSAAISGIAGLGHIVLGVAIVMILLNLKKAVTE